MDGRGSTGRIRGEVWFGVGACQLMSKFLGMAVLLATMQDSSKLMVAASVWEEWPSASTQMLLWSTPGSTLSLLLGMVNTSISG